MKRYTWTISGVGNSVDEAYENWLETEISLNRHNEAPEPDLIEDEDEDEDEDDNINFSDHDK